MDLKDFIIAVSLLGSLAILLLSTRRTAWGILVGALLGGVAAFPKSQYIDSIGNPEAAIFGLVVCAAFGGAVFGSFVAIAYDKARVGVAVLLLMVGGAFFLLMMPGVQ